MVSSNLMGFASYLKMKNALLRSSTSYALPTELEFTDCTCKLLNMYFKIHKLLLS